MPALAKSCDSIPAANWSVDRVHGFDRPVNAMESPGSAPVGFAEVRRPWERRYIRVGRA